MRLKARHFPATVPPTSKKSKPQRKCYVCQKLKNKIKDTTFMCKECDVGLCQVHVLKYIILMDNDKI